MEEYLITAEGLSKQYKLYDRKKDRFLDTFTAASRGRVFRALDNVSFQIRRGEAVGIIGTNGSGKSTLLKILTGIVTPTGGTFSVKGKISSLLELGAGFNPEFTGMENIFLNGMMMGFSREEMDAKLEDILSFAQIGEYIHQPVKTYSSGMFARLAFAVAINVEPEVLIIDETLSVGDMHFQLKCLNRIKEMMDSGVTILFVSHDLNVIRRFTTRCIWLRRGELVLDGKSEDVADVYEDFLMAEEAAAQKAAPENTAEPLNNAIAKLHSFRLLDDDGNERELFRYSQSVTVEVLYDVFDTNVKTPVLGVAVKRLDDSQLCGLNTLLDNVRIPWEIGRNRALLHYPSGLRLTGGAYYFDAALFDQTATVRFDYITDIKDIRIISEYIAEGVFIPPHRWEIPEN